MNNQSLNPILERRALNQQSIAKGFVNGIEDGNINMTGGHAYSQRSMNVVDEFRKSFGGKFDMLLKGNDDTLGGDKVLLTHKSVDDSLVGDLAEIKRRQAVDQLADNLEKSNIDSLEKGEIMDKLVYGYGANNDTFKFVKTGKEIKAMLPSCIEALAEQKGEIVAQMAACIEAAGVEPSEDYSGSQFKIVKIKRYPYDLIRSQYDEVSRAYVAPTDEQKACSQYNDLCYSLRSLLEDILACKIILANVEDDKKYNLTISQLVALTLGDDLINDDFGKSLDDDLEKGLGGGGVGSRGGKVISYTKSGKPIYEDKNNPEATTGKTVSGYEMDGGHKILGHQKDGTPVYESKGGGYGSKGYYNLDNEEAMDIQRNEISRDARGSQTPVYKKDTDISTKRFGSEKEAKDFAKKMHKEGHDVNHVVHNFSSSGSSAGRYSSHSVDYRPSSNPTAYKDGTINKEGHKHFKADNAEHAERIASSLNSQGHDAHVVKSKGFYGDKHDVFVNKTKAKKLGHEPRITKEGY